MEKVLVSVIVPVCNGEKYLRKAVKSIAAQTYRNLEILIVLNGCSDCSESLAVELAKYDSRIRCIVNSEKGLLLARKRGIEEAQGEYTLFFDVDDLFRKRNAIEKMVQAISEDKAQICQFGYYTKRLFLVREKYPMSNNSVLARQDVLNGALKSVFINSGEGLNANVWCKIFATSILKKQAESLINVNMGEDMYLSVLALTDKMVLRVACRREAYYLYHTGIGMSGVNTAGIRLLKDYSVLKPLLIKRLEEVHAAESVLNAVHTESIFCYRYVIREMLWNDKPDEAILQEISIAEQYNNIQQAKAYFLSHPETMNAELRFLCSNYTAQEYLEYCKQTLPPLSMKQRAKRLAHKLLLF